MKTADGETIDKMKFVLKLKIVYGETVVIVNEGPYPQISKVATLQ